MSVTNAFSLARDKHHPAEQKTGHVVQIEPSWQSEFKTAITNIEALCQTLELDSKQLAVNLTHKHNFPLRVPHSYAQRMKKSDPNDPLLLQVLPQTSELNNVADYSTDPVGDLNSIKSTGLLQKYQGRALLLATSRCAIHCRYCFRQHFPYSDQNPKHDAWQTAVEELKKDSSISEIILSGGDPLVLSDEQLGKLVKKLEYVRHISTLRIHTRLPVVIPNRICDSLLNWMKNTRFKVVIVLHINHAQEINFELECKLKELTKIGCLLLNQSVLLNNVNADADSLIGLSRKLFSINVLPYYLHMLDKVQGAAHFDVPKNTARMLMQEVSNQLPGYLVPKLVEEVKNESSKSLINY